MSTPLIKAIDDYIGEPLPGFFFIFFPAMLFAPLIFLFWAVDMMEKACPVELGVMLEAVTGEEERLLRELLLRKQAKVRKFDLWKLREQLHNLVHAAAQKRIDEVFAPN